MTQDQANTIQAFIAVKNNVNELRNISDGKPTYLPDITTLSSFVRGNITSVHVQDVIRGGLFVWKSAGYSADNGIVFAAAGGGFWVRQYVGAVSVEWYGAVGDGITDDTAPIQAALLKVKNGGTLRFGPKTYLCNSPSAQSYFTNVVFLINNYVNATIEGNNTTIVMNANSATLFQVCYDCVNVVFRGINFKSNHAFVSADYNHAIQLFGNTSGSLPRNTLIENCSFTNFSRSILLQGSEETTIRQNKFVSTIGRDAALDSTNPAVFIWGLTSNGGCGRTFIYNNTCNGFSGSNINATTTKKYMDGFIFGRYRTLECHDNTILNCGYESIFVDNSAQYSGSITIANNTIDCPRVAGQEPYAIRCNESNAIIENNKILNGYWGILCYTVGTSNLQKNLTIRNNTIYCGIDAKYAIFVQGGSAPTSNVNINSNTIVLDNPITDAASACNFITLYKSDQVAVTNNKILLLNQSLSLPSVLGIKVGSTSSENVTNLELSGNTLTGVADANKYQLASPTTLRAKDAKSLVTVEDLTTGTAFLSNSVSYTPGAISAGSQVSTTVTVSGAALGQFSRASFSLDLQNCTLSSHVSAPNTVTVIFRNNTASTVTLSAGTLKVRVE